MTYKSTGRFITVLLKMKRGDYMTKLEQIGQNAQRLRRLANVTQRELAAALLVSPETISAFENGRTNNALLLAEYLEMGTFLQTGGEFKCENERLDVLLRQKNPQNRENANVNLRQENQPPI